jgi:hypothetical protein
VGLTVAIGAIAASVSLGFSPPACGPDALPNFSAAHGTVLYVQLVDPDEQRRRFEQQAEELRRGDDEAQPYDEAFVQALEYGMPPTGGVGLGIDRLVMLLTGASTLREVVLFPAMRS